MRRPINHLLRVLLLFSPVAGLIATHQVAAQDTRVIAKIEFEGLQQISPDEALATAALKTDQVFKIEDVDAAAQRLLDSGIFRQVGYRTRTTGNKITITFQVEEARSGDAPVIFDNFIWFTDDQLVEAVRQQVPAFSGRVPNVGKMPEAITHALQQLLADHNIPGTVEYLVSQDMSGRTLGHVFGVRGLKMPICTFHFPGTKQVSEGKLIEASKEMADTDYSSELMRGFAGLKLVAVYRELGLLRAQFAAPVGKPDTRCKNGVDVTVAVTEGPIFSWDRIDWSGATQIPQEQLNQLLGLKQGAVANGVRFDKGVTEVRKAYGREGFLDVKIRPQPQYDDVAQKVAYKIDVSEGPQYRMGNLFFKGFIERDAKALRDAWRLRRGEIFNQSYLEDFLKSDAHNTMQRLFDERRAFGRPSPQISTKVAPVKEGLTVDVTLELAN